jgi:carboxyl-terminal processing protease
VDVEVLQVGSTTCGKPYGFYATDNCGTTYFTIQFRGVNEKNFGDYSDGFSPANSVGAGGVPLPGCSVGDDFSRALGDPLEARFAAALNYRDTQTCPAASGFVEPGVAKTTAGEPSALVDGLMHKSPWRQNRILPK